MLVNRLLRYEKLVLRKLCTFTYNFLMCVLHRRKKNILLNSQYLQVVAEDRDLGENGDVTYRFQTASDYFEINANTGDIKTSRLLEPAAVRLHRLAVIATDSGNPALSSTGM